MPTNKEDTEPVKLEDAFARTRDEIEEFARQINEDKNSSVTAEARICFGINYLYLWCKDVLVSKIRPREKDK